MSGKKPESRLLSREQQSREEIYKLDGKISSFNSGPKQIGPSLPSEGARQEGGGRVRSHTLFQAL